MFSRKFIIVFYKKKGGGNKPKFRGKGLLKVFFSKGSKNFSCNFPAILLQEVTLKLTGLFLTAYSNNNYLKLLWFRFYEGFERVENCLVLYFYQIFFPFIVFFSSPFSTLFFIIPNKFSMGLRSG